MSLEVVRRTQTSLSFCQNSADGLRSQLKPCRCHKLWGREPNATTDCNASFVEMSDVLDTHRQHHIMSLPDCYIIYAMLLRNVCLLLFWVLLLCPCVRVIPSTRKNINDSDVEQPQHTFTPFYLWVPQEHTTWACLDGKYGVLESSLVHNVGDKDISACLQKGREKSHD